MGSGASFEIRLLFDGFQGHKIAKNTVKIFLYRVLLLMSVSTATPKDTPSKCFKRDLFSTSSDLTAPLSNTLGVHAGQ